MEATLRDGVPAIEQARVAVVPLVRTGSPQEDLVRAAAAVGADGHVIGAHSQRAVFDSGGPAQAICPRAPAVVGLPSPGRWRRGSRRDGRCHSSGSR
jgi:hypothetical protein